MSVPALAKVLGSKSINATNLNTFFSSVTVSHLLQDTLLSRGAAWQIPKWLAFSFMSHWVAHTALLLSTMKQWSNAISWMPSFFHIRMVLIHLIYLSQLLHLDSLFKWTSLKTIWPISTRIFQWQAIRSWLCSSYVGMFLVTFAHSWTKMACRESLTGGKELVMIYFSIRVKPRLLRTLVGVGRMSYVALMIKLSCFASLHLFSTLSHCVHCPYLPRKTALTHLAASPVCVFPLPPSSSVLVLWLCSTLDVSLLIQSLLFTAEHAPQCFHRTVLMRILNYCVRNDWWKCQI